MPSFGTRLAASYGLRFSIRFTIVLQIENWPARTAIPIFLSVFTTRFHSFQYESRLISFILKIIVSDDSIYALGTNEPPDYLRVMPLMTFRHMAGLPPLSFSMLQQQWAQVTFRRQSSYSSRHADDVSIAIHIHYYVHRFHDIAIYILSLWYAVIFYALLMRYIWILFLFRLML